MRRTHAVKRGEGSSYVRCPQVTFYPNLVEFPRATCPEMEVTEIILAKIYGFCQLSSQSLWISLAHKTPSCDSNVLTKVVFDKTAFVNLKLVITLKKTVIKQIENNQKSIENPYPTSLWILKMSRKSPRTKSLETFVKSL